MFVKSAQPQVTCESDKRQELTRTLPLCRLPSVVNIYYVSSFVTVTQVTKLKTDRVHTVITMLYSQRLAEAMTILSTILVGAASTGVGARTRGSASTSTWERMPVVRRLYGEENSHVRRNVAELEERMERYQTGLLMDPNHIVPYDNHPYTNQLPLEPYRQRRIDDDDDPRNRRRLDEETVVTDLFQPMRIHFETKALDDMRNDENAAKIDCTCLRKRVALLVVIVSSLDVLFWHCSRSFACVDGVPGIENVILPRTREFWETALSVVPVSGKLRISAFDLNERIFCGDPQFSRVPDHYVSDGISETDLILFVSGSASAQFCAARTLAVAVACNFDQFDRPTAGAVNVCLDNIELNDDGSASDAVTLDYVDVSIHEVGHVLGMSSNSYRFFYDPNTGKPRTNRPFDTRSVTCVNGIERSIILPGESTMVFGTRQDGTRYASIVTEKVRQIARNQFDCQELEGASLENQPTRSDSCSGDHWDERLYYPEAMSGVIAPTANILSSLTLALMEDSGWYKANYTVSRMSPWGLGGGCDFVEQTCLTKVAGGQPTVPNYARGFFCASEGEKGCSSEHTHKMACQIINYLFVVGQDVPTANQFFPVTSLGGPQQSDFCPVYGSTYQNKKAESLNCKIPENTPSFPNSFNEKYGPDSHCVQSSSGEGRCYESFCVKEDMTFRFEVAGKFYVCREDFQRIEIPFTDTRTFPHTVTCPRLSQVCPDLFCPFNCAGRGICDYTNEFNGTTLPVCKCFDPADTSLACSDSLIPDGGFLDDAGTLLDNLEENFFDPLVAIFVDHPDKWTTASWAWAAGLISVGFVLVLCVCSSMCPTSNRKRRAKKSRASSRPRARQDKYSAAPTRTPPTAKVVQKNPRSSRQVESSRLYNM